MNNTPVETPLAALAVGEAASKSHVIGTLLPSESRAAAAHNSAEMKNYQHAGVRLFVNITVLGAGGGGATVTVKIQVKDPVSGTWVDVAGAATAALALVACTTLTLYPGVEEVANVKESDHLGLTWRVVATVANDAATFSVGGEYLT
jgi:succinyl-CoA synthetase beta subunit